MCCCPQSLLGICIDQVVIAASTGQGVFTHKLYVYYRSHAYAGLNRVRLHIVSFPYFTIYCYISCYL